MRTGWILLASASVLALIAGVAEAATPPAPATSVELSLSPLPSDAPSSPVTPVAVTSSRVQLADAGGDQPVPETPATTPQNQAREARHGAFSILFENDIFFNTDRDYTSGQELAYTTAADDTPEGLVDFVGAMPDWFMSPGEVRASYEIGQNIFTPLHTHLVVPLTTERPYAGFLYLGLGLLSRTENHLDQLEIQVGTTGPASLAQDAQSFVHAVLGQTAPAGWHYQLRDEPILQFNYERAFKIIPAQSVAGLFFDAVPHYGIAVGNAYDFVNAGAMARFGLNLPDDYGPVRMSPTLPGSNYFEPNGAFSAYVFAGIDGRAIARNIFLDGNSFVASRSVSKDWAVADFEFGAAIAGDSWRLSFTHVIRTREYRTQPKSDQFGAINLTFRT